MAVPATPPAQPAQAMVSYHSIKKKEKEKKITISIYLQQYPRRVCRLMPEKEIERESNPLPSSLFYLLHPQQKRAKFCKSRPIGFLFSEYYLQ